jgi:hypothetical protein
MSRSGMSALIALTTMLQACGGGSAANVSGGQTTAPSASNVTTLVVDTGPAGTINSAFATVTLCAPGTASCVTVDHLLVDSGSVGLRVLASLIPASVALPAATDSGGAALYECMQFADGYSWGSVRSADVQIGGERALGLPVHILAEASAPATPASCPNGAPPQNSVQTLGANGVLGIGVFREDCGSACVGTAVPAAYYFCGSAGCNATAVPLTSQVQNPVYRFSTDNNGVVIQLPAVGAAGQLGARGSLVFGIDTQANNQLGAATVLQLDPTFGTFSTSYRGVTLPNSFIDSGSNAYFFADASLPQCAGTAAPGFYCPATVQSLSAVNQSVTGVLSSVTFSVANAEALVNNNSSYTAFQSLAGINPVVSSFDWGLPFFYGRSVYFAIEGQSTSSGAGPFVAY